MNPKNIIVGDFYSDGQFGLREVVSLFGYPTTVEYRLHAAKVEQEFLSDGSANTILGKVEKIRLETFARWASVRHAAGDGPSIALQFRARRVKLSPGETAYMASVFNESGTAAISGTSVSYDHTEGRAVRGLHVKGFCQLPSGGEIVLTDLGAGYLRLLASQPAA